MNSDQPVPKRQLPVVWRPQANNIYHMDALEFTRQITPGSVQTVITSPPYWGLRDYQADGQWGLEETIQEHIDRMAELFRAIRDALHDTGTVWLNYGDAYASSVNGRSAADTKAAGNDDRTFRDKPFSTVTDGLKPKDLIGMPWRIALALQADGWYLRSDIIWAKRNPMPESVTDRPTKAHEYIFLLSKQPRYFYDSDAIREPHAEPWRSGKPERRNSGGDGTSQTVGFSKKKGGFEEYWTGVREYNPLGRNKRTVWDVATHAYPDAHFATFPPALIEPCILAGCAHEVCAACGAPHERVVEREFESLNSKRANTTGQDFMQGWAGTTNGYTSVTTKGFTPTCECSAYTRPGLVFDPFMGSGTTALVATRHGRDYLGCDVNAEYVAMAEKRLAQPTEVDMFTSMGIAV